jgi:hypothetical protein
MQNLNIFKICLITLILLTGSFHLLAQKGNSHFSFGAEFGPAINWQRSGFPFQVGVPVKAYLGTGKKGQLMLRSGLHHFPNLSKKMDLDIESLTRTAIPLAFGYRHNTGDWYVEGSFGLAYDAIITTYKDPLIGREEDITLELQQGIEFGKRFSRFDIGMSIYNQGSAPFNILFVGFKIMYRLGGKKKAKENWWENED